MSELLLPVAMLSAGHSYIPSNFEPLDLFGYASLYTLLRQNDYCRRDDFMEENLTISFTFEFLQFKFIFLRFNACCDPTFKFALWY